MRQWLPTQWYAKHSWIKALAPLSYLYRAIIFSRKKAYDLGVFRSQSFSVPVIVVGNITVGGTGKTPLVMSLARALQQAGMNPGIVSRGYKSKASHYPYLVQSTSLAHEVGDEALEMHLSTQIPVVIAADRRLAVKMLLENTATDVVLCDDGLQHYALQRSLEIGVIDGTRRFGNGWCLPAGPCREPLSRWQKLAVRVCHGVPHADEFAMQLTPVEFVNVRDPTIRLPITAFAHQSVQVVTGIGYPQRFINTLEKLDIIVNTRFFPDHHAYTEDDFSGFDAIPVIMTGKDAVKCRDFAKKNYWYLLVTADCDPQLLTLVRDHATSYTRTTTA